MKITVDSNIVLNSKLWTGDKLLEKGLKNKGYDRIVTTSELYDIFIRKELKSKKP